MYNHKYLIFIEKFKFFENFGKWIWKTKIKSILRRKKPIFLNFFKKNEKLLTPWGVKSNFGPFFCEGENFKTHSKNQLHNHLFLSASKTPSQNESLNNKPGSSVHKLLNIKFLYSI